MTNFHNFALKAEAGWATRMGKPILETRNVNDACLSLHKIVLLLFVGNNVKWKTLNCLFCCGNPISVYTVLSKTTMLTSNHIVGFFDH